MPPNPVELLGSKKNKKLIEKLKEEYDLIYLKNDIMSERVKKAILCDYMILPNILNKLSLNPQIYTTFINIQILNKLIMDNIKIIEFRNYYEEVLVANIIKQQIIKPDKIKQIYKELSLNEKEIIMLVFKCSVCYCHCRWMRRFNPAACFFSKFRCTGNLL